MAVLMWGRAWVRRVGEEIDGEAVTASDYAVLVRLPV
jgi:hypothetical protein